MFDINLSDLLTQLHDWQELVGAFLGALITVSVSVVGYLAARYLERRRERKETLRRVEVAVTYGLNSTVKIQQKLEHFVAQATKLVTDIRAITNPREFALQTVNFPALGEIYFDDETPRFRVKSYYLHNKLLWIHAGTKDVNGILNALKDDFMRVVKLNELMIELMASNPNPPSQRTAYAENIELFATEIDKFFKDDLPKGMKVLMEAKVYNDLIRRPFGQGLLNLWLFEGRSFKYFRSYKQFSEFRGTLESIDRIDEIIKTEIAASFDAMKGRAAKTGETVHGL